ncbi:hypothetical protein E2C01_001059 [Portunus trituberculatus]|uniref:Uncharacterized protein n=1 Tax=Portunus trituberculatus TaxID=210409 RepID=A0A5B7CLJ4_PORTR|nr:hypothetical protein [Portunus trituberculatus]
MRKIKVKTKRSRHSPPESMVEGKKTMSMRVGQLDTSREVKYVAAKTRPTRYSATANSSTKIALRHLSLI